MKVLAPKVETNGEGETCNSFPDDAPAKFVNVVFMEGNYTFYEEGDELPE